LSRLVLLRHGPTTWNADGRIQGSIDIPVSDDGLAQYQRLRLPDDLSCAHVVTSTRLRTRQTAQALGLGPATQDARLEEQHWGRWEGMTLQEIAAAQGKDAFLRTGTKAAFRPPGGESVQEVLDRATSFFRDAREDTVAVTHKGVLRAAYALATGWSMAQAMPPDLDTAKLLVLRIGADGVATIAEMNRDFVTR
jgi:broad specificity phosphatase PhoE